MKKAIATILPKPSSVASILVVMANSLSLDVPTENTLESKFFTAYSTPIFICGQKISRSACYRLQISLKEDFFSYIEKRSVHEKRNTLCDTTFELICLVLM